MKHSWGEAGLWILFALLVFHGAPLDAATVNVACPGQSLQSAVDAAAPGDIIQVSGVCNENVIVRNEKQRLTIQGVGGMVFPGISGPNPSLPAINVRGKGILLQGLTITGGKDGVHVNRGSNAVIDLCIIDSVDAGIRVDQQSFAVITNNFISGNTFGILVDSSSDARVGYNVDTDVSPSPNTIQSNNIGIWIQGASNAKIAGNLITNNSSGVVVRANSHADVGGNNIGLNQIGITVLLNSGADLGTSIIGPGFINTPNNSNAGSNDFFGLQCQAGGYVQGELGTLAGGVSPASFSAPCQNLLL